MGLELFGDLSNKMSNIVGVYIPKGDGEAVRSQMLIDFDNSWNFFRATSWKGQLELWVIARKSAVLSTLSALEVTLQNQF